MINNCEIEGRLTRDPVLKTSINNKKYLLFTLATEEKFGDKGSISFIPIIFWGSKAELLSTTVVQGSPLIVRGKLKTVTEKNDKDYNTKFQLVGREFNYMEKPTDFEQRKQALVEKKSTVAKNISDKTIDFEKMSQY